MSKTKKHTGGCLWLLMFVFFAGLFFGMILLLTNASVIFASVLGAALSMVLTYLIFGKPKTDGLIITISVMIGLLAVIGIGFTVLLNMLTPHTTTAHFVGEERVYKTKILENNDSVAVFQSNRKWIDHLGNSYEGKLTIRETDYHALKDQLKDYNPPSSANFWGNLYDYVERKDRESIDLVIEAFKNIQNERRLNRMEFAEMVVSCIQDIPYSFVFQDECLPASNYEFSIRSILEDCPECCIGNITYGLQNPVSFLRN